MVEIGDEALLGFMILLEDSMNSFDHEAAQSATHEQAASMLKVLKHYIWAIKDGPDVNSDLKLFLNCCGIEPEIPGSVVGGYVFAIRVLMASHECSGKDCVARHLQLSRRKKNAKKKTEGTLVDRNYKRSVKQPRVRVKIGAGGSRRKVRKNEMSETSKSDRKEFPNYFI